MALSTKKRKRWIVTYIPLTMDEIDMVDKSGRLVFSFVTAMTWLTQEDTQHLFPVLDLARLGPIINS